MSPTKKTGKKLVNYGSVISYYQKNNHTVLSGIDYLSVDLDYTTEQKQLFRATYNQFSSNSDEYQFTLPQFEGLHFKANVFYRAYFTRLEVSVWCDEFPPISIFSIFVNKTNSKATFTGKYFRYCQLKSIPYRKLANLLINQFDNFSSSRELGKLRIIRGDYKLDIFGVAPGKVLTRIKDYNKRRCPNLSKKQSSYIDNGELETHYIGSRKSKYAFLRIYNKFIDTQKKGNELLYFDYPSPTTRIELQTGSQFNGDLTLDDWLLKVSSYLGITDLHEGPFYIARRYDPDVLVNIENYYEQTEKRLNKLIYNKVDITPLCQSAIEKCESQKSLLTLFSYNSKLNNEPDKQRKRFSKSP